MTHFEYITQYLFSSWWHTWRGNFLSWQALVFGPDPGDDYYYYLWFSLVINANLTPSKQQIERVRHAIARLTQEEIRRVK